MCSSKFKVGIFFSRQSFSVWPWLSCNYSLWGPGWPWIQRSTCLCLQSDRIKGSSHHPELKVGILILNKSFKWWDTLNTWSGKPIWYRHFLNWGISFQMTLVYIKLTEILPGQWINTFIPWELAPKKKGAFSSIFFLFSLPHILFCPSSFYLWKLCKKALTRYGPWFLRLPNLQNSEPNTFSLL